MVRLCGSDQLARVFGGHRVETLTRAAGPAKVAGPTGVRESALGRTWEPVTRYISLAPQRCGVARAVVLALTMSVVGTPMLSSASPPAAPGASPVRASHQIPSPEPPVDAGLLAEIVTLRQMAAQRPARTAPPSAVASPSASPSASKPASKPAAVPKKHTNPPRRVVAPADGSRAAAVVAFALSQLGKPYRFATAGPNSFDCSGLAKAAYSTVGVNIPHQTGGIVRLGRRVERSELAPGDLVFPSSGHVGISLGGEKMVHAPQAGDVVKVSNLYSFLTARRLL